jgi:hypothetical protein
MVALIAANGIEAAVSRIDLRCVWGNAESKKHTQVHNIGNRTNLNSTGSGRVSTERLMFVCGPITDGCSANPTNFTLGCAVVLPVPKEMPPAFRTFTKALRIQLNKHGDQD